MSTNAEQGSRRHILNELGFEIKRVGNEMHGAASITPEMHVPGTTQVRISVLAAWADHLASLLAIDTMAPGYRSPLSSTCTSTVRPAPSSGAVRGAGRTIKAVRSVFVAGIDFFSEFGEPIVIAAGSSTVSPPPVPSSTTWRSAHRPAADL